MRANFSTHLNMCYHELNPDNTSAIYSASGIMGESQSGGLVTSEHYWWESEENIGATIVMDDEIRRQCFPSTSNLSGEVEHLNCVTSGILSHGYPTLERYSARSNSGFVWARLPSQLGTRPCSRFFEETR